MHELVLRIELRDYIAYTVSESRSFRGSFRWI